jgi:ACDE family multidrug resistance protein
MQKTKQKKLPIVFESDIDPNAAESESVSEQRPKRSRSVAGEFIAIASIPLVLVLGNSMLIPVLPDMKRALGVTQFQTSLIITLFSVTAGIFIPLLGYLSDRFTRKAIIIPSLAIYGGGGILAGFGAIWESYTVIIIARAVQGLGAAGTVAMALVGDMYEGAMESKALGLVEAANGTGKVISPILGSLLALITWYSAFFAFPVFCALSILSLIFLVKEPQRKKEPPALKQYIQTIGRVFREKGRWLVSAFFAGSLALFILFGVLFYLSDILEGKAYRVDGVGKGFVLAIPLLGMVLTSYITGSVIKKNGPLIRMLMNIGLALATVSFVLTIFFHKNIYVLIGLLTLSSIGTGLLLPGLNTMITGSVTKGERGMITSLYSSLRFFGVAFGPPFFGWLMEISHRTLFMTVSALSLVSLLIVFFFIKPEGRIS